MGFGEWLGRAVLELTTDDAKLNKGIDAGKRKAEQLERQFNTTKAALASLGVVLSTGALIAGIRSITRAFAEQEEAVTGLRASLVQTGKDGSRSLELLTRNATELQKVTTKGDEAIIAATGSLALLATQLSATDLAQAQQAMIGIADVFLRGDVNNAAQLLGKTIGSTTNALTRYGIQVDMTGSQSEKLRQIVAQTNSMFEVSKAKAETLTGKTQQLANAWGDFKETMGAFAAEGLGMINVLRQLIQLFEDWNFILTSFTGANQNVLSDIEKLNLVIAEMEGGRALRGMPGGLTDEVSEQIQGLLLENKRDQIKLLADIRNLRDELRRITMAPFLRGRRQIPAPGLAPESIQAIGGPAVEPVTFGTDELRKTLEQNLVAMTAERTRFAESMFHVSGTFEPTLADMEAKLAMNAARWEVINRKMNEGAGEFGQLAQLIGTQFAGAITGAIFGLNSLSDSLRSLAITVLNQVIGMGIRSILPIPGFQHGGMIPGMRPLPILAHPGEAVLNSRAVQAIGGASTIAALNQGPSFNLNMPDALPEPLDYDIFASRPAIQRYVRAVLAEMFNGGFRMGR